MGREAEKAMLISLLTSGELIDAHTKEHTIFWNTKNKHNREMCQYCFFIHWTSSIPDSKVHRANMEPTWVLSAPDGPHIGPMNLVIRGMLCFAIATPAMLGACRYMYKWLEITHGTTRFISVMFTVQWLGIFASLQIFNYTCDAENNSTLLGK